MEASQRGDRLLRAVVDALCAAGYAPGERHSTPVTSAVVLHHPGQDTQALQITHLPQHRCLQVDFLTSSPDHARRAEHTLFWYYQAQCSADLARIVRGITETVCGPEVASRR